MQKAVESALPSASVHSLLLPYLTVSLVINPEELVEEDKREVFSSSLTLGPSSPTARSLSFLLSFLSGGKLGTRKEGEKGKDKNEK